MIHFIPDNFVPKKYKTQERVYWNECVSLGILFIFGLIYSRMHFCFENTYIAEIWQKLRAYVHGIPMCPLCGGTRSFLALCRGDIILALHYSFFGTAVFFIMIFHFVLKCSILIFPELFRLRNIAKNADKHVTLLTFMLSLWGLQILLHYCGIFEWMVIK